MFTASHYHFLIRIKPLSTIIDFFQNKKQGAVALEKVPELFMQQFSNWQNSYAKAFNKVYERKGSLFMGYMRRVEIIKNMQLSSTVFYIHKNPVHHCFCNKIGEWGWTSYNEYAANHFSIADSKEIIEWFGSTEAFIEFHQQPITSKGK